MWNSTMQIDELTEASGETWFTEHLDSGVPIGSEQRVCIRAGFTFSADTVRSP